MPKRPDPIDSLKLGDPALEERVRESYARFRQALKAERDQFGRNRFVEMDRRLGRREGFGAKAIAGTDSITVDRAIAIQALMNRTLSDLVQRMEGPKRRIPSTPAMGYACSFLRNTDQEWRVVFRKWAQSFEVSESGASFFLDPWILIGEAEKNLSKAKAASERHIELLVELQPASLTRDSAKNLCWLLGAMAYIHRSADDLEEAANFLDLAFNIETRLDNLATRAFLYRDCAYLLSRLGAIDEAENCAQNAVDLSLASEEPAGLAESLFARVLTTKWQGETEVALQLLKGTQSHLQTAPTKVRKAALLECAWLHIDLDFPEQALQYLEEFSKNFDDLSRLDRGKYHLAEGVARSMLRHDEATKHFTVAEETLLELGSPTDQAIFLIYKCHYCNRLGIPLTGLVDHFNRLAGKMRRGSAGEAALLDVARLILSGSVTSKVLHQSLEIVSSPWAQQPRGSGRVGP